MRILVTGATGFAGSWLVESLLEQSSTEVIGLSRSGSWPASCSHLSQAALHTCDLCDRPGLLTLLNQFAPKQIYHLAGYASAGKSYANPDAAWNGNLTATRNLLEAAAALDSRPRILLVTSGMIYGSPSPPDQPISEEQALYPSSPYGTSKAAADLLGYQMHRTEKMEIIRARPFNHIGPRQSPEFALASFSRQLAEIKNGKREPVLETGDLSAHRDMTDVRDVVKAYQLLMDQGQSGEAYNVASGTVHTISSLLDQLIQLAEVEVEVRQKESLLRVTDTPRMVISTEKLKRATGWEPEIPLAQTLEDIMAYWRSHT